MKYVLIIVTEHSYMLTQVHSSIFCQLFQKYKKTIHLHNTHACIYIYICFLLLLH